MMLSRCVLRQVREQSSRLLKFERRPSELNPIHWGHMDSSHEKHLEYLLDEVSQDRYGVTDAKWIDDPDELIWSTPLMAQLQAKYNAITHFINDPGAVDFLGEMSDEDKALVAQRARELAARLKDDALNDIDSKADEAGASLKNSVEFTK